MWQWAIPLALGLGVPWATSQWRAGVEAEAERGSKREQIKAQKELLQKRFEYLSNMNLADAQKEHRKSKRESDTVRRVLEAQRRSEDDRFLLSLLQNIPQVPTGTPPMTGSPVDAVRGASSLKKALMMKARTPLEALGIA